MILLKAESVETVLDIRSTLPQNPATHLLRCQDDGVFRDRRSSMSRTRNHARPDSVLSQLMSGGAILVVGAAGNNVVRKASLQSRQLLLVIRLPWPGRRFFSQDLAVVLGTTGLIQPSFAELEWQAGGDSSLS